MLSQRTGSVRDDDAIFVVIEASSVTFAVVPSGRTSSHRYGFSACRWRDQDILRKAPGEVFCEGEVRHGSGCGCSSRIHLDGRLEATRTWRVYW